MFPAILKSTEALLVGPAELAFWKGDLGAAGHADQFALEGFIWASGGILCRSDDGCSNWRRLGGGYRCFGAWWWRLAWAHEVGQGQQVAGSVLAREFVSPFAHGVLAADVEKGVEYFGYAHVFVGPFLMPGFDGISFDHVVGVESLR